MYILIFTAYLNGDVFGDADVFPTLEDAQMQMRKKYEEALAGGCNSADDEDAEIDDSGAWVYSDCENKRVWYIKEANI